MVGNRLLRLQHPEFGVEFRTLIGTAHRTGIKGYLTEELRWLAELKAAGKRHPKEHTLRGDALRDINYLRLYACGFSIRIYFTICDAVIWMLLLDEKRQNDLIIGERLLHRLRDAMAAAEARRVMLSRQVSLHRSVRR